MKALLLAVMVFGVARAASFDEQYQTALAVPDLNARVAALLALPCADEEASVRVVDAVVQVYLKLRNFDAALAVCDGCPYKSDAVASAKVSIQYAAGDKVTTIERMRPFLTSTNLMAKSRANRFLGRHYELAKDYAAAEPYHKAAFEVSGTDYTSLASAVKCQKLAGKPNTYNSQITELLLKSRIMVVQPYMCQMFRALSLPRAEMQAFCDKLLPNIEPVPANAELIYLVQNTAAMLGK